MSLLTKQREPRVNLWLYNLLKWPVLVPLFYIYFRGRVIGKENVPCLGPFVAVSNHGSYFDPPLLSCALGRPVAYMAKEELFNIPILKQGIKLYGAYPVKRGSGDRQAIKAAHTALEEGWAVGIFLEGTRTSDGKIYHPKLGAAMIAAQKKVPLLPVSLHRTAEILPSTGNWPLPVPITISIGKLIPAPTSTKRAELEAITNQCAEVINQMLSQLDK